MTQRPTLQRRMAIDSSLMNILKGDDLASPTSSPSALSPNSTKLAPNRAARGLKREVAVRQLPIRLIEQIGAPSPRRGLIKRADTVSVFEWYQSVGLADTIQSAGNSSGNISCDTSSNSSERPSPPKVEMELQEDESINVFLDAWNQLDAEEENMKHQTEVKNVAVELVAIEALKEQVAAYAITDESAPEPRNAAASAVITAEKIVADGADMSASKPAAIGENQTTDVAVVPLSEDHPDKAAADNAYSGPKYEQPISQSFVEALIQYYATAGMNAKLPIEYAQQIVTEATKILQSEPTILDIPIPPGGKVVVCGDTHGQFPDLITILRDTGFPSPTQTIIFNGDFVDRGPAGVELIVTLYALKILFPKYLYLHRGNHEQDYVNKTYNFEQQVLEKYNADLYNIFQDSFGQLPLGAMLAEKVFIIHGGLPEDSSLNISDFKALPKLRDIPVGKNKTKEEKIIEDLLWSDPRDRRGIKPSKRGAGVEFGPDVTSSFISRNSLDLLVRSHELVSEGFQLTHDNQVMTVFSASYYCSSNTNKGAFIIFEDGADLKAPSVVQFYSQAFSAKDNVLKSCVKETLEKLRERIYQNRHALLLEFAQRDRELRGTVSPREWSAAMADALAIQIEWSGMLAYLAKLEEDGTINYSKFLERYKAKAVCDEKEEKINKRKHKRVVRDICTKLLTIGTTLEAVFAAIDENKDGRIDYLELYSAFSSLELDLTNDQIYDLMLVLDSKRIGMADFKDFTKFLGKQFERVSIITGATWISDALLAAGDALTKEFDFLSTHQSRLKSGFRKVPKDDDDKITHETFAKWLVKILHMDSYSLEDRMKISMYVDFNNNGKISWREFKRAFMALDGKNSLAEDILLHMCEVVIKSKTQLLRAFQVLDAEGSGKVDVARFKAGLIGMNVLLDNPLSDGQIKKLHHAFDPTGGGLISYSEFLDIFSKKDTVKMKEIAEGVKN